MHESFLSAREITNGVSSGARGLVRHRVTGSSRRVVKRRECGVDVARIAGQAANGPRSQMTGRRPQCSGVGPEFKRANYRTEHVAAAEDEDLHSQPRSVWQQGGYGG
jgi:hypothetical protein